MSDLIGILFQFGFFFGLLALGYAVGHYRERMHLRSIATRLASYRDVGVTNHKRLPAGTGSVATLGMAAGCCVVASDYFKSFTASIQNLFGGEMSGLASLITRARQEALLRMIEQAREMGANAVINVRFETAAIGGQEGSKKAGGVEVLAYGTALRI